MLVSRLRQLIVAVLSVTFGISMYIFMNSFMNGVNNEQTQITFSAMSHLKISNDLKGDVAPLITPKESESVVFLKSAKNIQYTQGIKNVEQLRQTLQGLEMITDLAAQLNQKVFIQNGITKASATLSGIETLNEDSLFKTSDYMVQGQLSELDKRSNAIILGTGLASSIGVQVGNTVTVTTSDGLSKAFKVIGLIETGAIGADKTRAIVSIASSRQFFSYNKSYATEMMVNIKDYNKAKEVAQLIKPLTEYKVQPWQEGNEQLDSANVLRDIIAIAVSLTILIVAGFGIYNIMNMTVNEKIKEIAILKAMGFSGGDITEIFLSQSIVIGTIGGLTGMILGNVIVRIIDQVPFKMASLTTLPVVYESSDYLMAFGFGLIITFLAGYLPAKKASRIDPVDILRG